MTAVIEEIKHGKFYTLELDPDEVSRFQHHKTCPTCNAQAPFDEILQLGGADWSHRVKVVQCQDCHTVFYENPPDQEAIDHYYKTVWNQRMGENKGDQAAKRSKSRNRMAQLLKELGHKDKSASILDVGCGLGDLMGGLANAGYENIWGTEMSPHRVAVTEQRFPGRVFEGGYDAVPEDRQFDIIYANHVLEHLPQPASAVRWMANRLTEGGIIILSVPDSWCEPVFNQVLGLPHLHSFCARSFKRLAEDNGLDIRYWTADRAWDMTAVLSRDFAQLDPAANGFSSFDNLKRPKEGSLVKRLQEPWLADDQAPRLLSLRTNQITRDDRYRNIGYRTMTGGQLFLAKTQLVLSNLMRAVSPVETANSKFHRVGYIKLRPQPSHETPVIVDTVSRSGPLQVQ